MKKTTLLLFLVLTGMVSITAQTNVEKWKIFELSLSGPKTGNPFVETELSAIFINQQDTIAISGFYDGNGIYKVRFMPNAEGQWKYISRSNVKALNNKKGTFTCLPPQERNHGPVIVRDTFHFEYSDGTPYFPFGTTCYGWVHQGDHLAEQTLKTLSKGYFNKMRMCIFPKDYDWNKNEPLLYPFEGKPAKEWDYSRFNPEFFINIENRISQLDAMGIEADLIVFHPYDRWGFSTMDRKTDDQYINYIIARFAAYKNVWWSMANEFDFMNAKKMSDWDHFIEMFARNDPYNHLRSIHNGSTFYDHTNPLLTHASIQNEDTHRAKDIRAKYKKPVIYDECRYEGNVPWSWGNLTAQSMTEKFWRGFLNGAYVGHGETYVTEDPIQMPNKSSDILWWSKGGILRGESPERIKFLKQIIESAPTPLTTASIFPWWMPFASTGYKDEFYLLYFNQDQPASYVLNLPENKRYSVEIIDTWNMTITPQEGTFTGTSLIKLPGKPYIAVRLKSL